MFKESLWAIAALRPTASASKGEETRQAQRLDSYRTDEEQIMQFLSECEGYAWQSDVGTELEWSNAKASRILSEMEDDGAITRYWIGRRKVVFLPGREPEHLT